MQESGGLFLSKTSLQFQNKLNIINAQDLGFTKQPALNKTQ